MAGTGAVPKSVSASISTNVVMNEMVDDIVGSEAMTEMEEFNDTNGFTHARAPPTPPSYSFDDSPIKDAGNETNYSLFGTLTAQNLAQQLPPLTPSPLTQQSSNPGPLLPSIFNSVFALVPDEINGSYSNIANCSSAQQLSPQPQSMRHSVQLSISSMPESSNMFTNGTINIGTPDASSCTHGHTNNGTHGTPARHYQYNRGGVIDGSPYGITSSMAELHGE